MSTIDFPTVKLQEFEIDIQIPNVIRHSSIYTAKEQIFSRGNMFFSGLIGWSARYVNDRQSDIDEIETFLLSCYGPVNDFLIPIPRDQSDRFDNTNDLTMSSISTDRFISEFSATAGLTVGDWINIGTRLHRITSADSGTYHIVPGIVDSTATKLSWVNPRLKARLAQDVVPTPRIGKLAGPWSVQVIEVV